MTNWHPGMRESATFDLNTIHEIQRAANESMYRIRGFGAKRHLPGFDDLVFLGASMSRYPLEGYREKCATEVLLGTRFAKKPILNAYGSLAILKGAISSADASAWLNEKYPNVRIDAIGQTIEIYKDVGRPNEVTTRFGLASLSGRHAIGHTRMATESAVTVAGSHPFSTGLDQCLVHNGSLSNHNRLRLWLQRQGIIFQTDNDSEVAAGYLAYQLKSGLTLKQSLEKALEELDGFYTFCIGTADGFAVLRDPIACKPAVLAETDDWVAMGSEYRALAMLPGIENARVWEPEPATVYAWSHT